MTQPPDLLGLPFPALESTLDAIGVGRQHASRVFRALHRDLCPLDQVQSLGWRRLERLQSLTRQAQVEICEQHPAPDGTTRLVFKLADNARVEGVLIPSRHGRTALCVSSQVGCAMACTFCATGTLGLKRGLTAGEIVGQVHAARRLSEARISHVVFMGMGEPLHHYEATRDALRILLDVHGCCFKARHLTVSTVGVVPKMRAFAADFGGRVQLALSLHAGTDATRARLIPLAQRYDLDSLRETLLAHPLPGTRCLMLEYVVLPGVNDSEAELKALAAWTEDLRCLVNLIPFNPFPGAQFRSPTTAEVERVAARLKAYGVPASIRWPKGRGIAAACGQLAGQAPDPITATTQPGSTP